MRRFFLILTGFVFVVIYLYIIWIEGISWFSVGGFLFFLICLLVVLFEDQLNQWSSNKRKFRKKKRNCQIKANHFLFPQGYIFNHGFLKRRKTLPFKKIDEIWTNTYPIVAKINDNELIFLIGITTEKLIPLAETQKIPLATPQDNWALLTEEFLDTEYSLQHQTQTISQLQSVGISEEEVKRIRKSISFMMRTHAAISWEWQYYGQYDVLRQFFPLKKKTYWWTMEIALRQ